MLKYLRPKNKITIIYFWEGKYCVAQGIEYDFTVQKETFLECRLEMRKLIKGSYNETINKYGIPFLNIPKSNFKFPLLWRFISIKEVISYDDISRQTM